MRKRRKQIYAVLLCMCMVLSVIAVPVSAAETEETVNTHRHTEECYTRTENCVHEHTPECYPQNSASENETNTSAEAETGACTHTGNEETGPTACTHVCSEESGCITSQLSCLYSDGNGGVPSAPETPQGNEAGEDAEQENAQGNEVGEDAEQETPQENEAGEQEGVSAESVQAMIDALPDAEEINIEQAEEIAALLEAIDEAKAQLSDEELEQIDFTRYMEAVAALGALSTPMLTANGTAEASVSTAEELTAVLADDDIATIKMANDITINTTLAVSRTVALDLNGHVLKMEGSGSVITVENLGVLTIRNSDRTIPHKFTPDSNGVWVLDETNGTEAVSGGIITGGTGSKDKNFSTCFGGGVFVQIGGALVMDGGAIVGCTADSGGGVGLFKYIFDDGERPVFTMNTGAKIIGCRANERGGGVSVEDGQFTMAGGSIDCCTAPSGGGVSVTGGNGRFVMSDGLIRKCEATNKGGGMYVSGNVVEMNGNARVISCAVADGGSGGGVYVHGYSTFTINGGRVGIKSSEEHNKDSIVNHGIINGTGGTIYGKLTNEGGTIISGTFESTVENKGGTVLGGDFSKATLSGTLVITFEPKNGEPAITQEIAWRKKGTALAVPSPVPTRVGYYLDGWYYDNSGTETKWDFDTGKVRYTMTLTAKWKSNEQFSLVPGETYYFDLSAVDIPGTKNSNLPDTTFHWVPFTYAGMINAYVLNSSAEEQIEASEAASKTTDSSAQYGYTYDHSLFIANYVVTYTVSWGDLHTRELIFGKDYTSGGISFVLRAPTVGSSGSDHADVKPANNEWDALLEKAQQDVRDQTGGYIKNWEKYSLGQDTHTFPKYRRSYRGYVSADYLSMSTHYTLASSREGFRPVLEIRNVNELGADGLKVVTLELNGGGLGGSSNDIQIIVKNGAAFTAPDSSGLTAPAGSDTTRLSWLGSDGNVYQQNAAVPATVTRLTAQWDTATVTVNGSYAAASGAGNYMAGNIVTISAGTRSGYTFSGWTSGDGITFADGNSATTTFTMPDTPVVVNANWKSIDGAEAGGGGGESSPVYYTLTFETNGGSSITAVRMASGTTIDLSVYMTARDGYDFSGWYAAQDLTQKITEIRLTENRTVYAGWIVHNRDADSISYADVQPEDWFYEDVMFAAQNGLMTGNSETGFDLYDIVTRARAAVIFYRMEGSPVVAGENEYGDMAYSADTAWYYDAVMWVRQNGIMPGNGDGEFCPDDPVTREQLAAAFYCYARYMGYDVTATGSLSGFTDADDVAEWAQEAVTWAVENGILSVRESNLLDPKGTVTRVEMAVMLHCFMEKYELPSTVTSADEDGTYITCPPTGDNTSAGGWFYILCTSAGAWTVLLIIGRRQKKVRQHTDKGKKIL